MKLEFAAQAYKHDSLPVSAQECINMYSEVDESTQNIVVMPTPGFEFICTAGNGPCLDISELDGIYYIVSGGYLYSFDGAATTHIGYVGQSRIEKNKHELFLTEGYVYNPLTGLAAITAPGFNPCSVATFQDGYIINVIKDSDSFQISAGDNAALWDALDVQAVTGQPGKLISAISDHGELWMFKERSTRVFYNSGNADFPFERLTDVERGCGGKYTVQKDDNTVFWLGDDGIVYRADGYIPIRISTHAIEHEISSYNSEPTSYLQHTRGHKFYVLSYYEGTWAYDVSTGLWSQRRSESFLSSRIKKIYGDIAIDSINGNIYSVNDSVYTENGSPIIRSITAAFIGSYEKYMTHSRLTIHFEHGVGLTDGLGDDPIVMLDWTENGKTWSNKLYRKLGKLGEYDYVTQFLRLGRFRRRAYRLTLSDPVKFVIIDAYAE